MDGTLTGGKSAIAVGQQLGWGPQHGWIRLLLASHLDGEGYNIDCTPTDQSGCWQHEENILAPMAGSCSAQRKPSPRS